MPRASKATTRNGQLEIFNQVLESSCAHENIRPPLVHLANSAATITLPAAYFDMVRPGHHALRRLSFAGDGEAISVETRARAGKRKSFS